MPNRPHRGFYVRKHLVKLTTAVQQYLRAMDMLMRQPSTFERGQKIAQLHNALEMANDQARYFGLGVDYRTDKHRTYSKPLRRDRTYFIPIGKPEEVT